jgi:hypothetical protein
MGKREKNLPEVLMFWLVSIFQGGEVNLEEGRMLFSLA